MIALKVAFFGSDPIALPLLNWLRDEASERVELIAIYTQPDRPVGRGQKLRANEIKQWALEHSLPVHQPEKLTNDIRLEFAALCVDVSLVMAYGHILKQDFIDTPRLGTLNFHASLLPHYRGASPIQTAIASGEKTTGISLMRIVKALDAGPVADTETVDIDPQDTAIEVEAKLSAACVPLLSRNLESLIKAELVFSEQEHSAATFCRRLTKSDGGLDLSRPASTLAARINGLFPWPASNVSINGQMVKIGLAESIPGEGKEGSILGSDDDALLVGTGSGVLRLCRLQRPGGRMLPARDFLRGFPIEEGTHIESMPMGKLVSAAPFRR